MRTSHASESNPFSRNPLFALASAFATGIYLNLSVRTDARILLFTLVLLLAATLFKESLRTLFILFAFVCAGAFVSGLDRAGGDARSLSRLYDEGWIASGDPVRIVGILNDHPQLSVDGEFLSADAKLVEYKNERIPTSGTVRLFLGTESVDSGKCLEKLELRSGNRLRIAVRLKREDAYLNPGTVSTISLLDQRGIHATGVIKSCFLIEKTGNSVSLLSPFYAFREYLTKRILQTHDRRTAGIVIASLLGNKNFLTKESGETFRENGTFHVLVISGLHITLIGGFILLAVRRLTSNRRIQFVAANTILWIYAVVVGLQPPVLRAALMYTVFLLGYAAYREMNPLNVVGAACLLILVWRPSDLFNPSFQLTFLSIFAIVSFALPLIKKIKMAGAWMPTTEHPFPPNAGRAFRIFSEALYWSELRWSEHLSKQAWSCGIEKTTAGRYLADTRSQLWLRRIFEVATVSFAVQLFLLPLLIVNFHRIGTASVISNLFAGGAVVVQNVFSIIAILISFIDLESARSFLRIASVLSDISLFLQDFLAGNLFRSLRIPVYTGFLSSIYFTYYLPLVGFTICAAAWDPFELPREKAPRRFARASFFIVFVLAAIMIFHPFSAPRPDGRLTVDFLDVGQGDSALVTFPDGRTLLIDGGGQRDFEEGESEKRDIAGIGEKVVSEFLWEKGYSTLDYVVSTHPDADHINGLTDVLGNFEIKGVFAGGKFEGVDEFVRFRAAAIENRVPLRIVTDGMVLKLGEVDVFVLNPARDRAAKADNDDSIVLRIAYRGRSFLFSGDIGSETETRIVESGIPLTADVVKVAHHGSRTSSTGKFVETTGAEFAVIPVGRRSPYGHPHQEVVERWTKNGSKVFLVGERGTITVSTDGSDLRVERYR